MKNVVDVLHRGLSGATLRHQVLSHNLANANTPGFKRSDVNFADELVKSQERLALQVTNGQHLRGRTERAGFKVVQDKTTTMRNDGNNVDVDREMVMLLQNQIHYQAMADMLNREFAMLRTAITEGKR